MSDLEYKWEITGMKTATSKDLSDAVVSVLWRKTGTDADGHSGSFAGVTPFDIKAVDPANFTPLEKLTEEQVLTWVKSIVVGHYDEHVEGIIRKEIAKKHIVVVETALPWAKKEETE